ncbi:MAG: beta-ketoacyl-[acyl-carrier-protein] synthase family protein [Acidobacteriota bacterium]|nr:beta-ketoacyl-[acyl-carrier-protein] synthase family protein [Acidobacteriota bacterium]
MLGRRVAITGMGVVSVIGVGVKSVCSSLERGRSGVRVLPQRRALGFRSALSGVIDDFRPRSNLSRKVRKPMPEFVLWAYEAVHEALSCAGLRESDLRSERAGVIFGNDSVARHSHEQAELTKVQRTTAALHSGMVFRSMNSTVSMNLSTLLGTQGANWSVSAACASGGHAIGQAFDLIRLGRQDLMICGGAQEITWEAVCSFDSLRAFSLREDDPARASRPFDRQRDGLVPSGGAAAIVLEDLDRAKNRGAEILGELLAYSFSADGGNIALGSGSGLARCMRGALADAGLSVEDVDLISAHGTSTVQGDAAEAKAIYSVFQSSMPWVVSTKSMTGHEMWMSGASQIVYAVAAGRAGFIPPNINFEEADEQTRHLRISVAAVDQRPRTIVLNAAGFGGTNSCILVRI